MQSEIGIRRKALLVATAMLWPVIALGAPQVPPSAPMTVVNTPANPVPVTGSVDVTGSVGVTGSVTINNSPSAPVPVSIVSIVNPAAPPTVHCFLNLGGQSAGSPFVAPPGVSGAAVNPVLNCPQGVTAIDVQRIQYDPWGSTIKSNNVAHFYLLVGLASSFAVDFDDAVLFPALTNAAPQADLPAPIRLDKTSGKVILSMRTCSSGIAGFNATCGGRVYFIGTAVSN